MSHRVVAIVVVLALAAGFGGGWIARDVATDETRQQTNRLPVCTEAEELRRLEGQSVRCRTEGTSNPLDDLPNPVDEIPNPLD